MAIESNNFNVDSQGNMECNKAICNDITIKNGKIDMFIDDTADVDEFALKDKLINSILAFTGHGFSINGYYDGAWTRNIVNLGIDSNNGHGFIDVIGNVYADNISSDKRLKENIEKSKINGLDIVNLFNVKSFDWKKDKKHVDAGIIAQEVEKIDENFVLKKPVLNKEKEVIDYQYYINELPIIVTLIKAIQELSHQVEELEKQLKEGKNG